MLARFERGFNGVEEFKWKGVASVNVGNVAVKPSFGIVAR